MSNTLIAGSAQVDISPKKLSFLYGYPHVKRYSSGIHDPLYSSALYISDGNEKIMFIANDIIWVSKEVVKIIRKAISEKIGIKPNNIMITATHTHSGPHTVDHISKQTDPSIPTADCKYVKFMQERIIKAGIEAFQNAQPAKVGLAIADDTGVGTNRRDPDGPADHNVPVMLVKNSQTDNNIACMIVCSIHPTVLHEDSLLVSGDFPGLSRIYLRENVLGKGCPVLHHTGPCGNQSPRYVTKANTFDEAKRLGEILGKAVEKAINTIDITENTDLKVKTTIIADLPKKVFPSVEKAEINLKNTVAKLNQIKTSNAPKQEIRTAECDWFGAEETLTLSKSAESGILEKGYKSCLPAEIQVIKIGDWSFVGWQGEVFIEYALEIKEKHLNTFIISLANGEMQGYIVTEEAAKQGGYEASNALFCYESGNIIVSKTLKLLETL